MKKFMIGGLNTSINKAKIILMSCYITLILFACTIVFSNKVLGDDSDTDDSSIQGVAGTICDVAYSTMQDTTGEVIATLTGCSEQVFAIPGRNLYHKFSLNGSHIIIFRNMTGDILTVRATVNWITGDNQENQNTNDKSYITGINHSFYGNYVILTWTSLISGDMDIYAKNTGGQEDVKLGSTETDSEVFYFESVRNYEIQFRFTGDVQNIDYEINNALDDSSGEDTSDDDIPTCGISYSTTGDTSRDVTAVLSGCSEGITPLTGYDLSHVFSDNGNHLFYFMDYSGNIGTAWANVDWIHHDIGGDTDNNENNEDIENTENNENTENTENTENNENFAMTGIFCYISGTKLNIIWTAVSNGIVDIYLWDTNTTGFEKVGSTNINYEEFFLDITRTGEYLFKFVPINSDEFLYSINIDGVDGINYANNNQGGDTDVPICSIKYDYINKFVVAILTGCNTDVSVINNGGRPRHIFNDNENIFTFEFKDSRGNTGRTSAYTWFLENFDNYDNILQNNTILGNQSTSSFNNYMVIYSYIPFKGSFTITGTNILLDNGAVMECNVTCILPIGNSLTINIDGLGFNSLKDILVPGDFAGYISYSLPKSFYTNNIFIDFDLDIKDTNGGSCLIDDISIISKPNTVTSTKKLGAKTGTYYRSHNIQISGLPENTAIPISASLDYTDTVIQNYEKCINKYGSSTSYCIGKYTTDIVLYKNGEIVVGGETVGQNGDIFNIKIKSSAYKDSSITANLMFGHTNKSIISQFTVSTATEQESHGSAELEYHYSDFDLTYESEWDKAYQYAYFYGLTTQSSIKKADMYGNLTRIAMAKMLSNYAINVLGYTVDEEEKCVFTDVSSTKDKLYDNGVTNACKLGIMGVNIPNGKFRPYDLVTRAEFATALSRLLYGTEDGKKYYYSTHLTKLKNEKIITDTNPNLTEKRGYVMLMLMRARQ